MGSPKNIDYEYDGVGRRIATELPLGQRSSTTYDAIGNVESQTDFNDDTAIATDKLAMRRALAARGVPCPTFAEVPAGPVDPAGLGVPFPLVAKPLDRSGSRGVTRVDAPAALDAALARARDQAFTGRDRFIKFGVRSGLIRADSDEIPVFLVRKMKRLILRPGDAQPGGM